MGKKENGSNSHTHRIGLNFNSRIEFIKEKRLLCGIDKKKKSTRKITDTIIKHKHWAQIENDTIELKMDGGK